MQRHQDRKEIYGTESKGGSLGTMTWHRNKANKTEKREKERV